MREELGGDSSYPYDTGVELLGTTGVIPAISGSLVTPVVAALTADVRDLSVFCPDEREVELVFTRSILDLAEAESSEKLKLMDGRYAYSPTFSGEEGKIW
eukprot:CAMPEP_0172510862 /NCGR_PEP_ID=MMETSP1066-20121228/231969_1 /TAXON_ID=671091 /ORGANISM="Coscinodiscus wailesii, Strain CCMP2513" /LENGTH=99 /DNA_ID=CAMNT_0013290021 /DNA_START=442 /DNA_END=738 /DNA_ORIENTATION=-